MAIPLVQVRPIRGGGQGLRRGLERRSLRLYFVTDEADPGGDVVGQQVHRLDGSEDRVALRNLRLWTGPESATVTPTAEILAVNAQEVGLYLNNCHHLLSHSHYLPSQRSPLIVEAGM